MCFLVNLFFLVHLFFLIDFLHEVAYNFHLLEKKYNVFPFEMDNIFDFATECEMTTTS